MLDLQIRYWIFFLIVTDYYTGQKHYYKQHAWAPITMHASPGSAEEVLGEIICTLWPMIELALFIPQPLSNCEVMQYMKNETDKGKLGAKWRRCTSVKL